MYQSTRILWPVLAYFCILLLLSALFYKARMLFIDPAWLTFNILNAGHLFIAEHRYGAFITQMIPLLGAKLHAPLSAILWIYSVWFYVFFTAVAYIVGRVLRQVDLALLLAFYFALFVSDVFWWPNNEVHQGIAWMMLGFGLLGWQPSGRFWQFGRLVIALICCFLALFNHFLVALPFGFLWLYRWLDGRRWNLSGAQFWTFSALFAGIFFWKFQWGLQGWYDGEKLQSVAHFSFSKLMDSLTGPHARSFWGYVWCNYLLVLPLFLLGAVGLWRKRQWVLLGLTLGTAFVYYALMCMTFGGYGRELLFYMESEWMGLGIVLAAPLVFAVLPQWSERRAIGLVSAILLVRLGFIAASMPTFLGRERFVERTVAYMKAHNIPKMVIKRDSETERITLMDWGLPVESLVYSAMSGDKPAYTFAILKESELNRVPADAKTMISCFGPLDPATLHAGYFAVDTTTLYSIKAYRDIFPE